MEWASTLQGLILRGSKYIFLLVAESSLKDDLQKALDQHFERFGKKGKLPIRATENLGENGGLRNFAVG